MIKRKFYDRAVLKAGYVSRLPISGKKEIPFSKLYSVGWLQVQLCSVEIRIRIQTVFHCLSEICSLFSHSIARVWEEATNDAEDRYEQK